MIVLRLRKSESIARLAASGHARLGAPGSDPLCAAVSGVLECLRHGLEHTIGVAVDAREAGEGAGTAMTLVFPRGPEADILLASVWGYLRRLETEFPGHLNCIEEAARGLKE